MFSNRSLGIRSLSLLLLLGLVILSFWGWLFVWDQDYFFQKIALQRYLIYNEFLLIGILFGLSAKHPAAGPHHEFVGAVRRSSRQTILGLFGIFIVAFALQDTVASRWFFFSYIPCLYVVLLFSNYLVPKWLGKLAFSGPRQERVALVGTLDQASRFKPWLERKSPLGLHTVGVISPQPESHAGNGVPFPILGNLVQAEAILKESAISQLIVLDLSLGTDHLPKLARLCEGSAVRVLALHDLNSYFNHTTTMFEDDGVRFISLREEPLESPASRFLKRTLDLAVAVPVVILILPVTTLLVWILQRLQSPGPIFFIQARAGMKGRVFKMFKYRTMYINHGMEAKQASKSDARIFPAGHWLRKLSLDEFPQFINVLKGDMSLVGPRPHFQEHEEMGRKGRFVPRMDKDVLSHDEFVLDPCFTRGIETHRKDAFENKELTFDEE